MVALKGHFDGKVVVLDEPANLREGQQVTVQVVDQTTTTETAWDLLEAAAGSISAPADWSTEHDHYLYGTPKRNNKE
jgi:hypothetical protein